MKLMVQPHIKTTHTYSLLLLLKHRGNTSNPLLAYLTEEIGFLLGRISIPGRRKSSKGIGGLI